MWKWILSIGALALLVRTGLASRAWNALRLAVRNGRLHAVWALALVVILLGGGHAFAAPVAASSANDAMRCNAGAYNSSGVVVVRAYCYFSLVSVGGEPSYLATIRAAAGTDVTVSSGAAGGYNVLYNGANPGSMFSFTTGGTWEVGPQTTSAGVSIPAGAALWRGTSSGQSFIGSFSSAPWATDRTGLLGWNASAPSYMTGNWYGTDESASSIDTRRLTGLNWFVGGSDGLTYAFCGATVTWSDPLTTRIFEGDVLNFTWTRTTGLTGNIDVRFYPPLGWADGGGAWETIVSESVIGTSGSGSVTVGDQGWAVGQLLGALDMRCRDIAADVFRYKDAQDDSNTVNDGVLRPCMQTRVTWPVMQTLFAGETLQWYIYHTSTGYTGSTDITVSYATWDTESGDRAPAPADVTWTTVNVFSPGEFGDYTLTAGFDGTARQFMLRCEDDQGYYYAAPWSTAARLDDTIPDSEESCYGQTGIGLRPSSWVPGLLRMGSCTVEVLFVPDPDIVSESWDGLVTDVSENAPVAWAYSAYTLVSDSATGTQAAVTAAANDCVQVVPDGGDLVDSAAGSVCPAAIDVGLLESARPWMGYMVWIGWAWSMYSAMFRKAPASTEPEQLTLF